MQSGRAETRTVREYLEALEQHKPKRGPKRDSVKLRDRLAQVETRLHGAQGLEKLTLVQERIDLQQELAQLDMASALEERESGFVLVAASYSERHGITPAAWRAVGVSTETLRRAGIV